MSTGPESDDIRRELAAVRGALGQDVRAVVEDVRTLSDWRHHFRRHPWIYCGAAAVVGYWLVPKRRTVTHYTVPVAGPAAARDAPAAVSEAPAAKAGVGLQLLATVGSAVARQAAPIVMRHMYDVFERSREARRQAAEAEASDSRATTAQHWGSDDDQTHETS